MVLVKFSRRIEPFNGPQVSLSKSAFVAKFERPGQQQFPCPAAANLVAYNKPAEMCEADTQVFAVDRYTADNVSAGFGSPGLVLRRIDTRHEFSEIPGYPRFEPRTESVVPIHIRMQHYNNAPDNRRRIACFDFDAFA
jgi:hypothetical protein